MRLLSANIGRIQSIQNGPRLVATAIFKSPSSGPVTVRQSGLEGDQQADLQVHGGTDKAVYAFPFENYAFYSHLLQRNDFSYGQFGENLTIEGFSEDQVFVGDHIKIGGALLEVSQPRIPCMKLGLRMGDARVIQAMVNTLRTGFYLRVLEEGEVTAGDIIEHFRVTQSSPCLTVSEVASLRLTDTKDYEGALRASQLSALSEDWKHTFRERIRQARERRLET